MNKKFHILLIFSNLLMFKTLSSNHCMYNLYTKFVKILEICKQFSENLVNENGNILRCGPVAKFSDLEVVALPLDISFFTRFQHVHPHKETALPESHIILVGFLSPASFWGGPTSSTLRNGRCLIEISKKKGCCNQRHLA